MKKMFLILAVPMITISCKKNDINGTQPCPIQQSTVAGRYVMTAMKYKAASSAAEQDFFATLDPCMQDDVYELKRDSSVTIGTGASVCPGPPPPGTITVWYVSADGKKFTLDAEYDIKSFDCTTLVVTENDYLVAGDTRTVTFSKQ